MGLQHRGVAVQRAELIVESDTTSVFSLVVSWPSPPSIRQLVVWQHVSTFLFVDFRCFMFTHWVQ
eukprot:1924735-Pyramimonas_sp.AAC.1